MLRLLALALATTLLAGCDVFGGNAQPLDLEREGTVPLEFSAGQFYVDESGEPALALGLRSEERFGCANHQIVTQVRRWEELLEVEVLGVDDPGICLTANGFAFATIALPVDRDRLRLRFHNGGQLDTATLVFTADSVRVVEATGGASKPAAPAFARGELGRTWW